jgi:hypothetical protein
MVILLALLDLFGIPDENAFAPCPIADNLIHSLIEHDTVRNKEEK